jgi:SRSO17 transposase
MQKHGPVVAWIVDDTGFPKQGKHSVGVARQYCGQVGKQDNCQVAVSLSVSTWNASLPIAWRLYLPEVWCQDAKRCQQAGVPEGVEFQTKPDIALQQIRHALQQQVPVRVVLADAGYGHNTQFRTSLTQLGLHYIGGIETTTSVWEPGKQPLPAPARKPGRGALGADASRGGQGVLGVECGHRDPNVAQHAGPRLCDPSRSRIGSDNGRYRPGPIPSHRLVAVADAIRQSALGDGACARVPDYQSSGIYRIHCVGRVALVRF